MITTTPDTLSATEDQVKTYTAAAVLANDGTDTGSLSLVSVTSGVGGLVSLLDGTITFTPDANFNGPASFTYTVSDGNGGFTTETAIVNVGAVNDAVTVESPSDLAPLIQGQQIWLDMCSISDVDAAFDPDATYTVTVTASDGYLLPTTSIGGVITIIFDDGGDGLPPGIPLTGHGTLEDINTWLAGIQYTTANVGNSNITVTVTDSFSPSGSGPVTSDTNVINLTVVPPHVAPTGVNSTIQVDEHGLRVFTLSDFGFADADGDSLVSVHFDMENSDGTVYYDPDGGHIANAVAINGLETETGLYYISVEDIVAGKVFYRPPAGSTGAGVDTFKFDLYDSGAVGGLGENASFGNVITVNVSDVANAAPVLDLSGPNLPWEYWEDSHSTQATYWENGAPALLAKWVVSDRGATVTDVDSANFDGGTLGVGIVSYGEATDLLTILHQGSAAGEIGVSGASVAFGGVEIGTFTGGAGTTPLIITFNANATAETVQALIRRIAYSSTSDYPGLGETYPGERDRRVNFVLTDGDGAISEVTYSGVAIITNSDPAQTVNDAVSTTEGSTQTGNLILNDLHDGGLPLQIAAVNGSSGAVGGQILLTSGALLTVNADGSYIYDPNGAFDHLAQTGLGASNDTATDSFTYTLADGDTATVTVTISGLYSAPHSIKGTSAKNALTGTAFDDMIDGLFGADTMSGGGGNDTYTVNQADDVVVEAAASGNDTIISSVSYILSANVENITLTGAGAKNATGNGLSNVLTGSGGDNILDGGVGADSMMGGGGDDIYIVDNLGDTVSELAGGGLDIVQSSVTYSLSANVERLILTGTAAINGSGNNSGNILIGNAGRNILDGGFGADQMSGGNDNDIYFVNDVADVVTEASNNGHDIVRSSVSYTLGDFIEEAKLIGGGNTNATGNFRRNWLNGNGGDNTLMGLEGDDRLNGGSGADTLIGGTGNDIYVIDISGDTVQELAGQGIDEVQTSISYTLGNDIENLTIAGKGSHDGTGNVLANIITGNGAANTLRGQGGDDTLSGGLGIDTLLGGAGTDILSGGAGNDIMTGGTGEDGFRFDTALNAATNVDAITDFVVADDTIHLSRTMFTGIASNGTLASGAFHLGTVAGDAGDRILYDAATGNIFYDADGAGGAAQILFAKVTAGTSLTNLDFTAFI